MKVSYTYTAHSGTNKTTREGEIMKDLQAVDARLLGRQDGVLGLVWLRLPAARQV